MNTKPTAIFFDLDGTIIDTSHDLTYCLNTLQKEAGLEPLPYESVRGHIGEGVKGLINLGLPNAHNYSELKHKFLNLYKENVTLHAHCFQGIMEILDFLDAQKTPWGIVTNKQERFAKPVLEHVGLSKRCAVLVGADTAANPKPSPDPLFHACEIIQHKPDACIYIGDSETDIIAGTAAGMRTIAVGYGYSLDPAAYKYWGATHHVPTPEALMALLRELI